MPSRYVDQARLAKLSAPRTSPWVSRTRLHRELTDAASRGAVWLTAGPGAGKTTLAACWSAARGRRALWFRADAGDRDPAEAFGYFARLTQGRRRAAELPAYRPQESRDLEPFARRFFRAFFDAIPAAATLVVDDAHAAAGSAFDTLLAAAIAEAPADVTVLVLSRQEPMGPLLDEVARGTLQMLDGTGLAFTADEAVELLKGRADRPTAERLQRHTGGWAAGLLLLARSGMPAEPGPGPAQERLQAYFAERVLSTLEPDTADLLAAVALLPDVDEPALHALGCGPQAAQVLERLRRQHSFVTRLERQRPSWRLHDLLREALNGRFDTARDTAWRARVLGAAAAIAEQRGLACDAVSLRLRAGDQAGALAAAERMAHGLVKSMRLRELDGVAERLGDAVDRSVPLLTALGASAWQRNDAATAVDRYERAYERLAEPAPSATGLWIVASALAAILEGWQDFAHTDRWMDRLRDHAAARASIADPDEGLRVDTAILQSTNMVWRDGLEGPQPVIARMLEALRQPHGPSAGEALAAASVLMEAAGYRLSDGALFREIVAAAAPWLQRPDAPPLAKAGWLVTYAPLGRRWPTPGIRLPAADPVACLEQALDLAREHGGRSVAFSGALFLALMAVAMNDRAAAPRRLATLREFVDPAAPRQAINLLEVESNVLALQGDTQEALAVIRRARELAERHAFPSSQMWNMEVYEQRLAIATGQAREARETLLRNAERYPAGNRRDFALVVADMAAAADALATQGTIPPEIVRAVITRAKAYDWPGFSAQLAPLSARLCAEALRLGIEPEFARRVVHDRHLPPPTPYEAHWPWPIRVRALGGFDIEVDGEPLDFGPRVQRKPLDLLKLLVAHGPAPVDAAVALDALWPDADGAAARASFDMALMRLRKLLRRPEALRLDGSHVGLDPACVWVDAYAFAHGASDAYPGPLFGQDAVQPWWAAARERLHQRYLRRATERGRSLEAEARHDAALAVYEAGLAQDPLAEELYQGAIRCHLALGHAADAMRWFRRCREQLSTVLGVQPSPATLSLAARARATDTRIG